MLLKSRQCLSFGVLSHVYDIRVFLSRHYPQRWLWISHMALVRAGYSVGSQMYRAPVSAYTLKTLVHTLIHEKGVMANRPDLHGLSAGYLFTASNLRPVCLDI